ncbi:MAG: exopolysaccharide biosynthesis protein [Maricaulaceae bacterium]
MASAQTTDSHPLERVSDDILSAADGDTVTVDDIVKSFGAQSFGPIFVLLGLLTILPPVSLVPGLPSVVGVVIILFSAQLVFGRSHVWLPGAVRRRGISKAKVENAFDRAQPALERLDAMIEPRWRPLVAAPMPRLAALIVTVLAVSFAPLELAPFAVAIPAAAIVLFGAALIARDGVLMAFGLCLACGAVLALLSVWLG